MYLYFSLLFAADCNELPEVTANATDYSCCVLVLRLPADALKLKKPITCNEMPHSLSVTL